MNKGLITGITGQDGSYLAEYLLVAQSHVRVSFDIPIYTVDTVALSTIRILEAIRNLQGAKQIAFYQASSSEMYGLAEEVPQNETTPFHPRSPYACAKAYAFWQTVNYRQAYAIHASNGILFNHESPRRGETFVTRKITRALAQILAKREEKLYLGNLDAKRDLGLREGLCRGHVAHAPATGGRRLRHRDGGILYGSRVSDRGFFARWSGLAKIPRNRPTLLPPFRGGHARRGQHQGDRETELASQDLLSRTGTVDGGGGPGKRGTETG